MGKYAKAIVAVATAGLIAAQNSIDMSAEARTWVTIVLAMLGAAGVYMVPNAASPLATRE